MPDPVAWRAVEQGWAVYDRDGTQVGTVHEIAGDTEHDIWDGFGVRLHRRGHVKYVPAENVTSIAVGEIRLGISADEAERLEDMHADVEERILPEKSRWYQRIAWWTTGRNR
ncbi:MAG TPA: hypothetical protein VKR23_11965 [Gaiellaceae bacterium]|nr:hypothetical protein [Gaiellaceae bacterium]